MIKKIVPFLLLLVAIIGIGYADGEPPYVVINIPENKKDTAQKYLTFDAEVNGKKVNALFDTGSDSAARILKDVATRIGIPPEGGKFDVKIGGIVVKDVPIRCVDKFNTSYPKDIIFGYGFTNKLYAIVDYPSNRALFMPCSNDTSYTDADKIANEKFGELKDDMTVPLVCPDGHILAETTVNGKDKLYFAVDTGWLGFNILTSVAVEKLGVGDKFVKLDLTIGGHDFKKVIFKNTRDPGLERSMAHYKKGGLEFGGIIGVPDFMSKYRIGIDYKEKKLHIGSTKKGED